MPSLKGTDIVEIAFRKSKSKAFQTALSIAKKIKGYRSEKTDDKNTTHIVRFEPAITDKKTLDEIENLLEIIHAWSGAFVTINGVIFENGIYEFYESDFAEISLLRADPSKNIKTSSEIINMFKKKYTK